MPFVSRRAALALLFALSSAAAHPCATEVEPNGTVAEAQALSATCFVGTLEPGDVDAWTWTLDAVGAVRAWRIEVEGPAGGATTVAIAPLADDDAAERPTHRGPTSTGAAAIGDELLFVPGRYLLTVAGDATGPYLVTLRAGDPRTRGRRILPSGLADADGAFALATAVAGSAAMAWAIDEAGAGQRWALRAQAPVGTPLVIELFDPIGVRMARAEADASGHARLPEAYGLAAGTYRLAVEASGPLVVEATATGTVVEGREVEPNDSWPQANLLAFDRPLTAAGPGDDRFVLDVGPAEAAGAWDLQVETSGELDLTLFDASDTVLQARRNAVDGLRGLVLAPGRYGLLVQPWGPSDYTLRLAPAAPPAAGWEREPNDAPGYANPLAAGVGADELVAHGELATGDLDAFRWFVGGDARRWRIVAIGEGVRSVTLVDPGGGVLQRGFGDGTARLEQLALLPGEHVVWVEGSGGSYRLTVAPDDVAADAADAAGGASPDDRPAAAAAAVPAGVREVEPNDTLERALAISPGSTYVGTLPSADDRDVYRLHLATDQVLRVELTSPPGGDVELELVEMGWRTVSWGEPPRVAFERRLPAGTHQLRLRDRSGAGGWYRLHVDLADPLAPTADREPNDTLDSAAPLPASLAWSGRVGELSDDDHYRLPTFDGPARLRLTVVRDPGVALQHRSGGETATLWPDDAGVVEVDLAPGVVHALRVTGAGSYALTAAFDRPPDPTQLAPVAAPSDGAVAFDVPVVVVRAYEALGQRVEASLEVANDGGTARVWSLEAVVDHPRAAVATPATVAVEAGARATVPIVAVLPGDLRDDLPLRLTVGLRADAVVTTASLTLQPRCEADVVGPVAVWPLPEPLLGRLDVAWSALGAAAVDDPARAAIVLRGRAAPSDAAQVAPDRPLTIDLAGDAPVTLLGTVLDPLGSPTIGEQLRAFEVWTSLDGAVFDLALAGSLTAARLPQPFAFDAPVVARFARLVAVDGQDGQARGWLGSWQLIADDATDLGALDLASPAVGGHVVWSDPYHGPAPHVLDADPYLATVEGNRATAAWVVGFHHGRAARIERVAWWPDGAPGYGTRAAEVALAGSLDGPLGPWTELGAWPVGGEAPSTLTLAAPTWVRYLRFEARGLDPTAASVYLPAQVQVFEHRAEAADRSSLGAWGRDERTASFEFHGGTLARDVAAANLRLAGDGDDDAPAAARPLAAGEMATGSVEIDVDVDHLALDVPEGHDRLEVRVRGAAVWPTLLAADGAPLPADVSATADGVVLRATVAPGRHVLRLAEPTRSVVFAWDDSNSMGPFTAITYSALTRFVRDLDPRTEALQLVVFDEPNARWLLPTWSADPDEVLAALARYDRSAESSAAYPALLDVAQALERRAGAGAVLLITDAETTLHERAPEAWQAFGVAAPRVFAFEVASGGSDAAQDLMQSWSAAGGGDYRLAAGVGDLDAGLARASCLLRRPKAYAVTFATGVIAPDPPPDPEAAPADAPADEDAPASADAAPATLRVVRPPGEAAVAAAVEVIFDASGSMWAALPTGETRLSVAKRVLEDFVATVLPDGTPFALRAFGHVAPESCETRLDVPLAPLDRAAALAAVRAIDAKPFSRTAIAASLAAVATDLAAAGGPRSVLLITDGLESCGGDPVAAVEGLRSQGIDVHLAIVSLGLDDPAAVATFEALAREVGAVFVATRDREALRDAVLLALEFPFEVLDADDAVVARGQVDGDAVAVPAGSLTLRVAGRRIALEAAAGVALEVPLAP